MYETRGDRITREAYLREHWRPLVIDAVKKYCSDKIVLDLGCGTGTYTAVIDDVASNVVGLDVSRNMLEYARHNRRCLSLMLADAHNVPIKDSSIDVIISVGLLEYVNRVSVLKEINRLLKRGGICIISVLNRHSAFGMIYRLICRVAKKPYFKRESSISEMTRLFRSSGFELVETKMDDGLICLPNSLDRLLGRQTYCLVESLFKPFGRNPFSNVMLFVARKK